MTAGWGEWTVEKYFFVLLANETVCVKSCWEVNYHYWTYFLLWSREYQCLSCRMVARVKWGDMHLVVDTRQALIKYSKYCSYLPPSHNPSPTDLDLNLPLTLLLWLASNGLPARHPIDASAHQWSESGKKAHSAPSAHFPQGCQNYPQKHISDLSLPFPQDVHLLHHLEMRISLLSLSL